MVERVFQQPTRHIVRPSTAMNSTGELQMETLETSLCQGLQRAEALKRPVLISLSQPAPQEWTPMAVLAAGKSLGSYRTFWARPSDEFGLVGIGSATVVAINGERPIHKARQEYQSLLEEAVVEGPEIRGVGPVFIGGFRFDSRTQKSPIWADFPDGLLVLPRFLLTSVGRDRWLTINIMMSLGADPRAEAERAAAQMEALAPDSIINPALPPLLYRHQTTTEEWSQWVRLALQAIEGGQLAKVVLARRMNVSSDPGFSLESVLSQLSSAYTECSIFAMDNGSSSFVGATPEPLAHLENGALSLSCLAGTIGRGATPQEDEKLSLQLLDSTKDRLEHDSVVRMVADTLGRVCEELQWNTMPQVVKLHTVQHLATFFRGRPKGAYDILELVELLHPTPAVGGMPVNRALETISQLEGDRGWYAAPVGWLDNRGEGEFDVAIRSALLRGNQATLFAGSGIVQGSDPHLEFIETDLKFQPLLTALGHPPELVEGQS